MNDELFWFFGGLILGAILGSFIWLAAIDANYSRVVQPAETGMYIEYQQKLYYAEAVVK